MATQPNAVLMEAPRSTSTVEEIINISNNNNHHQNNNSTNGSGIISRSRQPKQQQIFMKLEQLPDLVLDKILDLLEPQDLRSAHQVSKTWKNIILRRPRLDSRRVELVTKIRLNKENIAKGCSLESATPSSKNNGGGGAKNYAHDGKPGSRSILRSVSNSRPNSSITSTKKPLPRSLSTPTSRFLQEFEAGKKLLHGQTLFRCPKCTGPVPSPISSSFRQLPEGFRQRTTTDASTPQKSSTTQIVPSPGSNISNITQDSGFESLEVPADQQHLSMISIEEDVDSTTEEIALSFIASPPSSSQEQQLLSSSPGLLQQHHQQEDEENPITEQSIIDSEISFSSYNISSCSSASSSSSRNEQRQQRLEENESIECPKCSHRFCCNCQCTEHPGRPCKEISGDSLSFTDNSNNSGGTNNENTNLKSDKAKRSKKALRRLARV